jgi:hypothetical protein
LTFSAVIVVYGTIVSVVTYSGSGSILQTVAIVLCASGGVVVHGATRPMRPRLKLGVPIFAVALSVAGAIVSAFSYHGPAFGIAWWWAPGAVALTIASLGPYLPAREIGILGGSASLAVGIVSTLVLGHDGSSWGALGTALVASYPPALGTVATATFSWAVVTTLMDWAARPNRPAAALPANSDSPSDADNSELENVERMTARAMAFVESIADAAAVVPADRAMAAELARHLRDDLVVQSELNWLHSVADVPHLVVVDADRRARHMNIAQRTALRALIRAILDIPGIDRGSLLVDVRAAEDGATAVAVSLDRELPEGHTVMHLAPYYLTLASTVEDLSVARDKLLRLSFRVMPNR